MTAAPGEKTRFVLVPAARVSGRVVSKLPGVKVGGLEVYYQGSRSAERYRPIKNSSGGTRTDIEGGFTIDGLSEGTINVFVHGEGENSEWTYRAASDVKLTLGVTSELVIELIRGVEVAGLVVERGSKTPLLGAQVGVYGPFRPRSGAMTTGATTDGSGRYRYRLPSGETYFYVMGPPHGFTRLSGEGSAARSPFPKVRRIRSAADRARTGRDASRPCPRLNRETDRGRESRRHLRERLVQTIPGNGDHH